MSFRPLTNTQSLSAQRSLFNSNKRLGKALTNLSSGSRINSAADDAAGLAISELLRARMRSTAQANRNASDGTSLLQVAEGALQEVSNIIIRMRELSMQAATDTVGPQERGMIDIEYQNLKEEIDRIARSTEFTGRKLLNGTMTPLEIQVGNKNNASIDRIRIRPEQLDSTIQALGLTSSTVLDKAQAQQGLSQLDRALMKVSATRAELGGKQNRLQSTIRNLGTVHTNMAESNSKIRDTDLAKESSDLSKEKIIRQANIMVLTQANQSPTQAVRLIENTESSSRM